MDMHTGHFSYLALGDSYTIGESVPLRDSFPYQLVQLLRNAGFDFYAPEIVAQTGWTSFELAEQLQHARLSTQYDFVSLLIGVNNQYRGLPVEDFSNDFESLLSKAIHLAGERSNHVIVLSIPDWGYTPFGKKDARKNISQEIDRFNDACAGIAKKKDVAFVDITQETRKASTDLTLLAKDQLHYSAKEHRIWSEKMLPLVAHQITKG